MKLKGILSVLAALVFFGATVAGGTGAFFSDSETSSGNSFTAGALDLLVDSQSHYNGMVCTDQGGGNYAWEPEEGFDPEPGHYPVEGTECDGTWELTDLGPTNTFFNLTDLKPGDSGENTISLHVVDNDSYVCAIVDNLEDNDLGITEPEATDGDVTDGLGNGELSPEIHFFAWNDDGDNKWEVGEEELFSNVEGPVSDVIDGVVYPLFTPQTAALPGIATAYLGLYWCYGEMTVNEGAHTLSCNGSAVTNLSQSDQILADITFYVEQARHNNDFQCPILAGGGDDDDDNRAKVGSDMASSSFAYGAPSSCTKRVKSGGGQDYTSISTAIADTVGLPDGSTLCVEGGTYNEFTVNRPLTVVGSFDPKGGNAAVIHQSNPADNSKDALVKITSSDVTVRGFKVDGQSVSSTWFQYAGIRVITAGGNLSNITIDHNIVSGIKNGNPTSGKSAIGIQVFAKEDLTEDISNVQITNNVVSDVKSVAGGAHGMQLTNDLSAISVLNNTVSDVDGVFDDGISVDANNPANSSGVTISYNELRSAGATTPSVQIEGNPKASDVKVNQNNLETLLFGTSASATGPLDAKQNWWGTAAPAVAVDVFQVPAGNIVDFSSPEASPFSNY